MPSISYVRLQSVARTDMSNASFDSENIAYIRALKAINITDQSNLSLINIAYFRGLQTMARTDQSNIKLKNVYRRSLRSKPTRTDRSNIAISFNRVVSCKSTATVDSSKLTAAKIGVRKALKASSHVDQSKIKVFRMARKYLGFPPSGSISILALDGERPLDRAQLVKGNTYALNVKVQDSRLAGYVIAFDAIANIPMPAGPKVIRLSSDRSEGGGLDDFTVVPAKAKNGSSTFDWLAQGILYASETSNLSGSVVFDWKLTYKIPCFGESYQLASGQFIVF